MKLLSLDISHFKGIRHFELSINGENATIYGDNATGKTTVYDAFLWLLFGKDSADRKDFSIKPLGADGNPAQSGVETSVTARLEVEGQALALQRVYGEKWEKKRGSAVAELTGNTTAYYIDELPIKQAEYKARVEAICPEAAFKALTGVEYFCQTLPWQDRRRALFELAGGITEQQVVLDNPDLEPLIAAKGQHSVSDYKRIVEKRRAMLNKELEGLPARVDEATRALIPLAHNAQEAQGQTATLRAQRQQLTDTLAKRADAALSGIEAEVSRHRADLSALDAQNMRWQVQQREKRRALIVEKNQPVKAQITAAQQQLSTVDTAIELANREAQQRKQQCDALYEEFAAVKTEQWDGDLSCPTCKCPYEAADVDQARAMFTARQRAQLLRINQQGAQHKAALAKALEEAQEQTAARDELQDKVDKLCAKLVDEQAPIEVGSCDGYVDGKSYIQQQIDVLTARMTELTYDRAKAEAEINRRIARLDALIDEWQGVTAAVRANARTRARIQELLDRQKEAGAELERSEHDILLCEQYIRAMVRVTESKVDGLFEHVHFKLFDQQINGGLVETCTATVDGVPYADLNHAMRINAGLDVVRTLGRHKGITAPVFVDNAESVVRLMDVDAQVIRLVVSQEDKLLRVEIK